MKNNNNVLALVMIALILLGGIAFAYKSKSSSKEGTQQWNNWTSKKWKPKQKIPEQPKKSETGLSSYSEALQMAKTYNRKMLLVFGNRSCVYCEKMKATTLVSPSVQIKMGREYVYYYVDTNREPTVTRKYGVSGIPYYVIVDPHNERVERAGSGYKNSEDFINWMDGNRQQQSPG